MGICLGKMLVHNIEEKREEGGILPHATASRLSLVEKVYMYWYTFVGWGSGGGKKAEWEGLEEEATPPLIGGGVESVVITLLWEVSSLRMMASKGG